MITEAPTNGFVPGKYWQSRSYKQTYKMSGLLWIIPRVRGKVIFSELNMSEYE